MANNVPFLFINGIRHIAAERREYKFPIRNSDYNYERTGWPAHPYTGPMPMRQNRAMFSEQRIRPKIDREGDFRW
jgi:hypothetical protein